MTAPMDEPSDSEPTGLSGGGRRSFLAAGLAVTASALGALAFIPALGSALDPLLRRGRRAGGFLPVGKASLLTTDAPVELPVVGSLRDAWTLRENQQLGSVWLRKKGDRVVALSGECPHLGCRVGYDSATNRFDCPCHDAHFSADGVLLSGPAKRGLDPLEARIANGVVEVRFRRFRPNVAERVEVA